MNYKELVLSHNPSAYVNYDSGAAVDLVGVMTSAAYNVTLNPVYDYRAKAHGMRSKRIGSSGGGSYDSLKLSDGLRREYLYVEAWVYVPTSSAQDIYIWQAGSSTNPSTNTSNFVVTSTRTLYFYTSNGSLSGNSAHTMQTAVNTVPTDQWVHLGAKYSGGAKTIYMNGIPIATATAPLTSLNGSHYDAAQAFATAYVDEWVLYWGGSASVLPTDAQILARATFPKTKTVVWSAPDGFWITSGDELYWDGTQWISMQSLPYKVWNGTEWVPR